MKTRELFILGVWKCGKNYFLKCFFIHKHILKKI